MFQGTYPEKRPPFMSATSIGLGVTRALLGSIALLGLIALLGPDRIEALQCEALKSRQPDAVILAQSHIPGTPQPDSSFAILEAAKESSRKASRRRSLGCCTAIEVPIQKSGDGNRMWVQSPGLHRRKEWLEILGNQAA
jgi:hypothetical protein